MNWYSVSGREMKRFMIRRYVTLKFRKFLPGNNNSKYFVVVMIVLEYI